MNQTHNTQHLTQHLLAAIDLGSNSFHLVVAKEELDEIRILETRGEKVRLASGLDDEHHLSEEAQLRGLECLKGFASRVQGLPTHRVKILATNALRKAKNRNEFIEQAETILGYPISVISGREEARLIYKGVSHTCSDEGGKRFVVDIGGGSTEFIIGQGFTPLALESLHMGCISYTQRFFPKGKLTKKAFEQAILAAKRELLNIRVQYRSLGWSTCIGASGTVRAIERVCSGLNTHPHEGVFLQCLYGMKQALIDAGHIDDFTAPQIKSNRKPTLAGGLSILIAIFEELGIDYMAYSEGALREGALYEMISQKAHKDVQERTLKAMQERFHVDLNQVERVTQTAIALWSDVKDQWSDSELPAERWLTWSAKLHTIGLAIAHNQFHKHGAYIIKVADMLGFTRKTQQVLSFLVRAHRRKFPEDVLYELPKHTQVTAKRLAVILRLAVLIHHAQEPSKLPKVHLSINDINEVTIHFDQALIEHMPITYYDLVSEQRHMSTVGIQLHFQIKETKSKKNKI